MAFAMALSMLAGCSKEGGDTPEEDGSISINVIGTELELPDLEEGQVYLTGEDGSYVTGVDGNVLTEPAVTTTMDPSQMLSEDEILAAMTEGTTAPNLELTAIAATERYAYNTLTADEKKLYDEIVSGIEGLKYKICDEDAYTIEEWGMWVRD